MIRYALCCPAGHEFEGWFASSRDYDEQKTSGLLECPVCGAGGVAKQIMAPNVASARLPGPSPSEIAEAINRLHDHVEATHEDVGDAFADEARAIHAGRAEERGIYGQASGREVAGLISEGVPVAPLPSRPRRKSAMN